MVTNLTPIPSFDAYYGLNQTPSSSGNKTGQIVMIVLLATTTIVTVALLYKAITENKNLKKIVEDNL